MIRLPFYWLLACLFISLPVAFASESLKVSPAIQQAGEQLAQADSWEQQARERIREGSLLRKQLKKSRQNLLQMDVGPQRQAEQKQLDVQVARSLELQNMGSDLRKQAAQTRLQAEQNFSVGLQQLYQTWILDPTPIQLVDNFNDKAAPVLGGHNVQTRSVHPRKQDLAGTVKTASHQNMSLDLPRMTAQQVPGELNTSSFKVSRDRRYLAHIEVERETVAADNGSIAINELHAWRLVLTDLKGGPVKPKAIKFIGHMPGHVHGLPTQPRMTSELAPGVFKIEGVKFQMRGWWVIELLIEDAMSQTDSLRFNLQL